MYTSNLDSMFVGVSVTSGPCSVIAAVSTRTKGFKQLRGNKTKYAFVTAKNISGRRRLVEVCLASTAASTKHIPLPTMARSETYHSHMLILIRCKDAAFGLERRTCTDLQLQAYILSASQAF